MSQNWKKWKLNKFKNNTAVITESGQKITYEELDAHCQSLTDKIGRRCLVFNLCRNETASLAGYTGFLNAKIVPLMLKADLDKDLLKRFIITYKPDYLHVPSDMAAAFTDSREIYKNLGYSLIKTPYNNEFELHDELALLLTTSGSTGSPKLVRQSYKNIEANTKSIVKYLNIEETERAITTLPMNYTYGISIINTHLMTGACLILTEKGLMQKEFWQQLKENKATSFGGVPYTYEMLERLRFFRMDLPSLKYLTQAGSPPICMKNLQNGQLRMIKNLLLCTDKQKQPQEWLTCPVKNRWRNTEAWGLQSPAASFH